MLTLEQLQFTNESKKWMNGIKNDPSLILSYMHPTPQMWNEAIKRLPRLIKDHPEPSVDLCKLAINIEWDVLKFIKQPSDDLCFLALIKNPEAIEHVPKPTQEMCEFVLNKRKDLILKIKKEFTTPQMWLEFLEAGPEYSDCFKKVPFCPTPSLEKTIENLKTLITKDNLKKKIANL